MALLRCLIQHHGLRRIFAGPDRERIVVLREKREIVPLVGS
jgi:hypothetical protein